MLLYLHLGSCTCVFVFLYLYLCTVAVGRIGLYAYDRHVLLRQVWGALEMSVSDFMADFPRLISQGQLQSEGVTNI